MKLLIVVDMQNDFIDGSLGILEAVAVVPKVAEKIRKYRDENSPVVFTRDTHDENYLKSMEGKNLPVVHCVKGSEGWKISSKLEVGESKVFDKPTFGSLALAKYVSSLENLEEIEIVGVCTDICVISNAILLKAAVPEVKITVDSSCCAGVTPRSHENALAAMKMCQINII